MLKALALFFALFAYFISFTVHANLGMERSIGDIAKDEQGRFWVATSTGLFRYDGGWTHLSKDPNSPFFDIGWFNTIDIVQEGRHHFIIAGTANDGVYLYNVNSRKTHHFIHGEDINAVLPNKKGVYIGSEKGLYFYDFQLQSIKKLINNHYILDLKYYRDQIAVISHQGIGFLHQLTPYRPLYFSNSLQKIAVVGQHIYVASRKGLLKFDAELNPLGHFYKNDSFVSVHLEANGSRLWVGGNNLIRLFDTTTHQDVPFRYNKNCFGRIFSFFSHAPGDMWIGGENMLFRESSALDNTRCTYNYFIAQYNQHQFFIATESEGIGSYDTQAKSFTPLQSPPGFDRRIIYHISFSFGYLWIATNQGLIAISPEKMPLALPQELTRNHVFFTEQIDQHQLAVGTKEHGLYLYTPETGELSHYTKKDGLPSNEVLYAYQDSDNNLWVASGISLSVKRAADKTFQPALSVKSKIQMFTESGKDLFIATHSKGFYQINRETLAIKRRFNAENSFISNNTSGLFKYGHHLYFQTIQEILRFNLNTQKFEYRFPSRSRSFTNNTFFELSKEKALIATPLDGVRIIDLPTPTDNSPDNTIISGVKVDHHDTPLNNPMTLSRTDRIVNIQFNRQHLLTKDNLKCSLQINNQPEVNLVNGEYTHLLNNFHMGETLNLVARCANAFGEWDNKTVHLKLKAPVSAPVIALGLSSFGGILFFLLWHFHRINPLRRQVASEQSRCYQLESTMDALGLVLPEEMSNDSLYHAMHKLIKLHKEKYNLPISLVCGVDRCNNLEAYTLGCLVSAGLAMAVTDRRQRKIVVHVSARSSELGVTVIDEHDTLLQHQRKQSQGWKNFVRCYESFSRDKWEASLTAGHTEVGYRVWASMVLKESD